MTFAVSNMCQTLASLVIVLVKPDMPGKLTVTVDSLESDHQY